MTITRFPCMVSILIALYGKIELWVNWVNISSKTFSIPGKRLLSLLFAFLAYWGLSGCFMLKVERGWLR